MTVLIAPVDKNFQSSGLTARMGLPAWRSAMTARTWGIVPGTDTGTLSAINPALNAAINPNHPGQAPWLDTQSIIGPWCGAIFDADLDRFVIPIGGGHSDYYGNEPYLLDLRAGASMAWQMVRAPSGSIQFPATLTANGTNFYSDGRPRATHTYNHICHVPGVGPFCLWLSAASPLGSPYATSHPLVMDADGEWAELGGDVPFASAITAISYDASRDCVWCMGAGTYQIYRYSMSAETFTAVGSAQECGYLSLTRIESSDLVVLTTGSGYTGGQFRVFDPVTNAWTSPSLAGSAPSGFSFDGQLQPHWLPDLGCLAVWNNSSNTTKIATLTPGANPRTDAWTWGELSVDGSNAVTPSAKTANGTYGRFQYSPALDGLVLLNGLAEPTYFFALS